MLQSTKKSLRDLAVDCVVLALVSVLAMSLVGCDQQGPPKLIHENRTDSVRARVVEVDHESIPEFVVLRARIDAPGIHEVGAIAPVSEGLELNDEVQLHWTEIFNTTNVPYSVNHFRRATKVKK